jgi:hypothetical protein
MAFKITKVETKCADTCEECDSQEKPVYHLKGKYDNIDAMLCKKCLKKLKENLNKLEV